MKVAVVFILSGILLSAGCSAPGGDWPDRRNRTPERMLEDLVQWQQNQHVKASTGELAYECFADVDFEAFESEGIPIKIATQLRRADDFRDHCRRAEDSAP
jgi:hypothetical protein